MPYIFVVPSFFLIVGSFMAILASTRQYDELVDLTSKSDDEDSDLEVSGIARSTGRNGVWFQEVGGRSRFSWMRWTPVLLAQTAVETVFFSWAVVIVYGFIPEVLAVVHLARVGVRFTYVCADKPASSRRELSTACREDCSAKSLLLHSPKGSAENSFLV